MAKTIERQAAGSVPMTYMYPRIIAGVCEWCGIKDGTRPSTDQYKLCDHFKAMGEVICSYCPETTNFADMAYKNTLKVHQHPDNPDKVVVVCDSMKCMDKHIARFKQNA